MKSTGKYILALIITIMIFSGCKKIKELFDISFDVEYSVQLDVIVPPKLNQKAALGSFSANATIDPLSDSEFSRYLDKIKSIEITEISAKVISISRNVTLESASIFIYSNQFETEWSFINEIITVGKVLSLDNDAGQWNTIQNLLEAKSSFNIEIMGETDVDDAQFTFELTVKSRITANPLD